MKLAVFGASGPTGQKIVEQALAQGHNVTALVHSTNLSTPAHEHLRVVRGDIHNIAEIEAMLAGQDVVISALGIITRQPTTFYSNGWSNIVAGMKTAGIKRFIGITSAGVAEDPELGFIYFHILLPLLLKNIYADMRRAESVIERSGLDWTIVRPTLLTKSQPTGQYRLGDGYLPKAPKPISRADVADFIVKALTNDQYRHRKITIVH